MTRPHVLLEGVALVGDQSEFAMAKGHQSGSLGSGGGDSWFEEAKRPGLLFSQLATAQTRY